MIENKKNTREYEGELKFVIYLEDDDTKKEKYAIVKEDEFWVELTLVDKNTLKPYENVEPFKIPKTRVLKMKGVKNG